MLPKVIDLFSGCGGLALGFEKAGFDIVAGIELMPEACKTISYNLSWRYGKSETHICGDITEIDADVFKNSFGEEGCIVIGMIDQAVYVYNQETMEVFEVAIGSKKKKKIYKPDKTDVLYYTYKNHLIRGDMEKEKFYYLKDSAWEELEGIASFTNTFGDFAEYYDKKNVLHVVYGDSLFKDQKKELFERK